VKQAMAGHGNNQFEKHGQRWAWQTF